MIKTTTMNTPDMVDMIHTKLAIRYGARWLQMYDSIDPKLFGLVKADWCEVLRGVSLKTALHALDNLPSTYPPNAGEFALLCRNAPIYAPLALPRPPRSQEQKDKISNALVALTRKMAERTRVDTGTKEQGGA